MTKMEFYVKFNYPIYSKKNKILLNTFDTGGNSFNSNYLQTWDGGVDIINPLNCSLTKNLNLNGVISSISISINENEFALSNYYSYIYHTSGSSEYQTVSSKKNVYIDSSFVSHNFLNSSNNKIDYTNIQNLQFSPDSKMIFGTIGNNCLIWDKSSMKPIYSFVNPQLNNQNNLYRNFTFTRNSKRLLAFNKDVLQILSLEGDLLKDSMFFKQNYICNSVVVIDSTNKFLIGGNDGVLRLFEEELMNKGLVSYFKKDSVTYFANQPIQFRDFSDGKVVSRFWNFGDSSTSKEQNPIHIYKKSGDYSVKLIVFDGTQYDTLIKKNYIQLRVKAEFETANIKVIAPFKVDFVNNSKGDNKTFKWYFGDGDSSNYPIPSHYYTKAGLYDVKLIVSDGTYSDTLIKKAYIKVVLPLQAGFEITNNIGITPFKVDFKNVSTGEITSYKWYFGDGDSSNVASPSHTYTKGGNFTVSLIVSDGISSSTYTKEKFISVSDNLSVEGGPAKEEIPPFSPNPVKDKLFIQISEFNNTDKIQIIDLNGRKLIESELKETIDVSSLSKGIYFLKIGNRQWKFVKE